MGTPMLLLQLPPAWKAFPPFSTRHPPTGAPLSLGSFPYSSTQSDLFLLALGMLHLL